MKRYVLFICLCLFVIGLAAAQAKAGGTMYVSVKTLTLKSGTGFFAGNTGTLNYGDRVTVTRVTGNFVEVKNAANASLTGWTAIANLSAKQVLASASGTASAKELALAGKGFSQEVENSYNKDQKNSLNYADVDKSESILIRDDDLKKFLEEGRLKMGDN